MAGTNQDVSERKDYEETIHQLAFHDALTQLPNRRLFNDRLKQALARAQREGDKLALLFIDLDKFKPVNDEHGHEVGDLLLQSVAQRILGCIRASDTAARVGGDEFVVFLTDLKSTGDAAEVAEKIRFTLQQPFVTAADVSLNCSCSMGVAIYPDHGSTVQELLRVGDDAMYCAKQAGGNRVNFSARSPDRQESDDIDPTGLSIVRLVWKGRFSCGHPEIDREHRELFHLANILFDRFVSRAEDHEGFDAAFNSLLAHTVAHFAHEEKILEDAGYPHVAEHAKLHQTLIETAMQLGHRVATEEELSIATLIEFLVEEMIAQHMLIEDRKFFGLFARSADGESRVAR